MARKSAPAAARSAPASKGPATPAAATPKAPTLASLRGEIDRLDKELVAILNRRAEVALQIGQVKSANGIEVWSAAREEEVLARAVGASRGPLPEETLRLIFRELMSGARSLQRTTRVACLGPKYSYSHLAAVAKFGESVEYVPVDSIAAVFEEVNRRHVQFGVVPLENSTDGRIADTLDVFTRLPNLKIRAEVRLKIHHCLLGRCEWSQIRRVYSKAQALSQCRNWLGKNLPQAMKVEVVSTTAAAELAQREEFAAAVASKSAGHAYKLNVLVENIEDRANNLTRFAVIAETPEARTGHDKTTLMARLPNAVGSLAKTIAPLEKLGVNLSWIESFPTAAPETDANPSYVFFLDIEGHAADPQVEKAIEAIRKRCERLDVLGSYPRSAVIEG